MRPAHVILTGTQCIVVCMWVCIGLVADVGLVVCQQQRSLGADPGMMSLPARPRSRSYLWHCVFEGESRAPSVCVCALVLFLCGDVVIVSCLCQLCVSQTPSYSCPQKITPGDVFFWSCSVWVSVSFTFTEWNMRLFAFFYLRFMSIEGQTDVWQDDISHSWYDLDVGGETVTVRQSNQIDLFMEWKQLNSPWQFSHFSFTVRLLFLQDVWSLFDAFHVIFVYVGLGRGEEQGARERNHWSKSQCLCLCLGFPLSLFSLVPTTASSFKLFSTTLFIFTFLPVYLTRPLLLSNRI